VNTKQNRLHEFLPFHIYLSLQWYIFSPPKTLESQSSCSYVLPMTLLKYVSTTLQSKWLRCLNMPLFLADCPITADFLKTTVQSEITSCVYSTEFYWKQYLFPWFWWVQSKYCCHAWLTCYALTGVNHNGVNAKCCVWWVVTNLLRLFGKNNGEPRTVFLVCRTIIYNNYLLINTFLLVG
jgi:hypothetical protein